MKNTAAIVMYASPPPPPPPPQPPPHPHAVAINVRFMAQGPQSKAGALRKWPTRWTVNTVTVSRHRHQGSNPSPPPNQKVIA